MMRNGKGILVLGGGVGGIVTANELRGRLGTEHQIVLVDKVSEYVYSPSLLWVMVGAKRPDHATKELRRMLRSGIEVHQTEVQEVDPVRQRVRTSGGEHDYDYLVVALGADMSPASMPGYQEAAHNFFDLDGATALWRALQSFSGGRLVVAISTLPYKCPAAPYEAALLLDDFLRRRGLRERVDLQIFTPENQPMPTAGPMIGEALKGILKQQGIRFNPSVQLATVDAQKKELVFKDGARVGFDLLAAVPPHRPPRVVRESPLANEAGWIPVDKRTLRTRFDNIYAIGDVATIALPNGRPLPKAGVFAHAEGLAVARTIAGQIQGRPGHEFDGVGFCWVSMARGRAGFASGDFYAEPEPAIKIYPPGWLWHLSKTIFEKYWMGDGISRTAARLGLLLGSRALGLPANV